MNQAANQSDVVLEIEEGLYSLDAIYGTAYVFIDRCYVLLDRPSPGRISVRLRPKADTSAAAEDLMGEFENELLGQAWRRLLVEENRKLVETVTTHALAGAAGPPGLDDLLDMDIDDQAAFDDPLGIAVSWEDKYKKRDKASGGASDDPSQATPPKSGGGEGSSE